MSRIIYDIVFAKTVERLISCKRSNKYEEGFHKSPFFYFYQNMVSTLFRNQGFLKFNFKELKLP